jgi:L-alanine-DL-glutamate epimerase-like enolase superfamily enzyme
MKLEVSVQTVPTDAPEADGTLSWSETTIIVVEAHAEGERGVGYTYSDAAAGALIEDKLAGVVEDADPLSPPAAWSAMRGALRNAGRPGLGMMAISAVDTALWDLKARLLRLPLCELLGALHDGVPVYGSGGFTSYDDDRLCAQLAGWVEEGIPRVKMKVGSDPNADPERVRRARQAIGEEPELFVDANGAYTRKQALELAHAFREQSRVSWLEEPVSSQDVEGLRLVRDQAPAGMEIAAGEYAFDPADFVALLGAVDVLQADITRCGGVTGLLGANALARGHQLPLSLHCAPALHAHAGVALDRLVHLEYFHDHVRIEHKLFDGVPALRDGALVPDRSRPGNGLEVKR